MAALLSPTNLLVRLNELKQWQAEQQARLGCDPDTSKVPKTPPEKSEVMLLRENGICGSGRGAAPRALVDRQVMTCDNEDLSGSEAEEELDWGDFNSGKHEDESEVMSPSKNAIYSPQNKQHNALFPLYEVDMSVSNTENSLSTAAVPAKMPEVEAIWSKDENLSAQSSPPMDVASPETTHIPKVVPKRPFLRKGAGLQRFRMSLNEIKGQGNKNVKKLTSQVRPAPQPSPRTRRELFDLQLFEFLEAKVTECENITNTETVSADQVCQPATQQVCQSIQEPDLMMEITSLKRENQRLNRLTKVLKEEKLKQKLAYEEEMQKMVKSLAEMERKAKNAKEMNYLKQSQHHKIKKSERQELAVLQKDLNETKEQLKAKEIKHSATIARLRNQLHTCERQLDQLRHRNSQLETVVEKKRNSNHQQLATLPQTRILHEINRNLSKMAAKTHLETTFSSEDQCKIDGKLNLNEKQNNLGVNCRNSANKTADDACVNGEKSVESSDFSDLHVKLRDLLAGNVNRSENASCEGKTDINCQKNTDILDSLPLESTLKSSLSTISANKSTFQNKNDENRSKYVKNINENPTIGHSTPDSNRQYYPGIKAWQTIVHSSGEKLLQFSDGQLERHLPSGAVEVYFADGSRQITAPDGSSVYYLNKRQVFVQKDGVERTICGYKIKNKNFNTLQIKNN